MKATYTWFFKHIILNKFWLTCFGLFWGVLVQVVLYCNEPSKFTLQAGIEFVLVISSVIVALIIFYKPSFTNLITKKIIDNDYNLVLGLSSISKKLLDDAINESKENEEYVLVDQKFTEFQSDYYIKSGIGLINCDSFDLIDTPEMFKNFHKLKRVFISLGQDRLNIELAIKIIDVFLKKLNTDHPPAIKVIVHIENRALHELFLQNVLYKIKLGKDHETKIDIQIFSFYEEVCRKLFEEHSLESKDNQVINSNDDYEIVIVGDGFLTHELIYFIGTQAVFPNQNQLTINLVHPNAGLIKQNILNLFNGILNTINLKAYELDPNTFDFYVNDLWHSPKLSRVYLSDLNEDTNIERAIGLFNKTYFEKAIDGNLKVEVFFAAFNSKKIELILKNNIQSFANFYSFGQIDNLNLSKALLGNIYDQIAKAINLNHKNDYSSNKLISNKDSVWFESNYFDRESSKAQARHISIKLKALGLKIVHCKDESRDQLLKDNKKLLNSVLMREHEKKFSNDIDLYSNFESSEVAIKLDSDFLAELKNFSVSDLSLFQKVVNSEHERWCAYHFINGWSYSNIKDKKLRRHDCLTPLMNFNEKQMQTVLYDIHAVIYIPSYLADMNYKIVKNRYWK